MKKSRKKHHKRKSSRRHRVSGVDFTNVLGVVAGAVAAGALNKVIPDTIDPKIVAGGKVALGVFLPNFVKSGKLKNVMAGVGSGMVAVGAVDLLKEFGVLSGTGEDEVLQVSLNGDQDILAGDTSVLAGDDLSVVNGDEDVINGDDLSVVNGMDDDYDFN